MIATFAPAAFADDFDEAHKRVLGHGDLQFTFGPRPAEPVPPDVSWLSDLLRIAAPFFNVVFWGALAAAVLGLLFFIGREVWQARYGRDSTVKVRAPEQQTDYRPEPERARALLQDADRFAAQGRYEDAVRTLLHRSIDDIEQRSPRAINRAQTSREIARLSILPPAVRDAFAPLVRAVERSWFGGLPLAQQDYQTCRDSYVHFALPEAWK